VRTPLTVAAMPIEVSVLLAPSRTAIVTSEVQNGVVGEPSALPALAEEARAAMLPNLARLLPVARAAGVQVVHCTAFRRADGKGSNSNARLFAGVRKSPVALLPGTSAVDVVPELGPEPEDLVLTRTHGLSPMAGTDLDPVLRNLGIGTIVVTGASVNIAVTNLVMDAVNHGYSVVLPRDAVAGWPRDYANAVIDNTLSLLAWVVTTDDLITAWTPR
jgi:nicotinamidase-related amidase